MGDIRFPMDTVKVSPIGVKVLVADAFGVIRHIDPADITGEKGDKGWSARLGTANRGDDKVFEIVDFIGGSGAKPTGDIGKYIGATGYVTDINEATALPRGADGKDFTFEDLTSEQIALLQQPAVAATEDAITAGNYANAKGYFANAAGENANNKATLAVEATEDAVTAKEEALEAAETARNARGWSRIYLPEADGANREVEKLADYEGGTGDKPTFGIGKYRGASGLVETPAEAVNIKGGIGVTGDKAWTEDHREEVYLHAENDERVIKMLFRYINGEGTPPTDNIGLYLKPDGTYTAVKADATNYRSTGGETNESVMIKYEANPNRNALTDDRLEHLESIEVGATKNASDADLRRRDLATGTQTADTITDGLANKVFTAAEKIKLANQSNTNTGDETTLSILQKIGDGTIINQSHLPSYVDDVVDGYKNGANFYKENTHTTLILGEIGKIYIDLTTGQSSRQYRWSGSVFIQITNGLIASTNDVAEGSNNLYFTAARVLGTVLAGLSVVSSAVVDASDTVLSGFGKLQAQITLLVTGLASKANISPTAVAGTVTAIQFDLERTYGTNSAAITAASITTNSTGATAGVTAKLYILRSTAPSFPAAWKLAAGSAPWHTTKVNRIFAQYEDSSNIFYTIASD